MFAWNENQSTNILQNIEKRWL